MIAQENGLERKKIIYVSCDDLERYTCVYNCKRYFSYRRQLQSTDKRMVLKDQREYFSLWEDVGVWQGELKIKQRTVKCKVNS